MASTTGTGKKTSPAGKSTARTSRPKKSAAGRGRTRTTSAKNGAGEGLRVHVAHASIPVPYVTKGDVSANARAAGSAMPDLKLPPAERLAFYGGLGALAVVGALEWPVAAAIGAATVIARRSRREK